MRPDADESAQRRHHAAGARSRGAKGRPLRPITTRTRVLVTGASGFIGSRLTAELSERGAQITATSRVVRPDCDRIDWRQADLGDAAAVDTLFSEVRPHVVFHLASAASARQELHHVRPMFTDNLESAVNVLTAATATSCERVVLAGSMEEPDGGAEDIPSSPYGVAKSAQTLYARFFHKLYGTPVVVARIFMVYGPGQRTVTKLVPYSILAGLEGRPAELAGGERLIDWVHVDDVAHGLVALGEARDIEGRVIDIGSGRTTSVEEIVTRIATKLAAPAPMLGARSGRVLEAVRSADPMATYSCTGFWPQVTLDAGLDSTIAWYRAERAAGSL